MVETEKSIDIDMEDNGKNGEFDIGNRIIFCKLKEVKTSIYKMNQVFPFVNANIMKQALCFVRLFH